MEKTVHLKNISRRKYKMKFEDLKMTEDHVLLEIFIPKHDGVIEIVSNVEVASPEIKHDNDKIAKYFVRGAGPDVKNCKVGDRVLFNHMKGQVVTDSIKSTGIECMPGGNPEKSGFLITEDAGIFCVLEGEE
jgi:hypothetical protein